MFKRIWHSLFKNSGPRREKRETDVNGTILINGIHYPMVDWSFSGFSVKDFEDTVYRGDRLPISVQVETSKGASFTFDCTMIVVRFAEDSKELAGAFVEVPQDVRVALADYFD
ncbi:hypothetical protein [Kiloniella sp. b19]|uniref:hypothetical protein n=1 Tax=Kiloniella sp. GXU_MW_B19 TaxID=3141326 RepID=UPI0031DA6625